MDFSIHRLPSLDPNLLARFQLAGTILQPGPCIMSGQVLKEWYWRQKQEDRDALARGLLQILMFFSPMATHQIRSPCLAVVAGFTNGTVTYINRS